MFQHTLKRDCCKYRDSTINGLYATMFKLCAVKFSCFAAAPFFKNQGILSSGIQAAKTVLCFGYYFLILLPDFTLLHVPYKVSLPDFL